MEELNNLEYLDHFTREVLRLHSPIGFSIRVAMKDDMLPLKHPYTDRNGKLCHEILYVTDSIE